MERSNQLHYNEARLWKAGYFKWGYQCHPVVFLEVMYLIQQSIPFCNCSNFMYNRGVSRVGGSPLTPRSFTVSIFRGTSLQYLSLTKQLLVIWKPPFLKMEAMPLHKVIHGAHWLITKFQKFSRSSPGYNELIFKYIIQTLSRQIQNDIKLLLAQ